MVCSVGGMTVDGTVHGGLTALKPCEGLRVISVHWEPSGLWVILVYIWGQFPLPHIPRVGLVSSQVDIGGKDTACGSYQAIIKDQPCCISHHNTAQFRGLASVGWTLVSKTLLSHWAAWIRSRGFSHHQLMETLVLLLNHRLPEGQPRCEIFLYSKLDTVNTNQSGHI